MLFWKTASAPAERVTAQHWKSDFCRLEDLPMFPAWAAEALEVANQPDSSLRELAHVIQRDLVLTAGVLKLANSSLYSTGREITSVEQAVIRLGVVRCRHVILAIGLRSLWHDRMLKLSARWAQYSWQHAQLVGQLAARLAQRVHLPFQGEDFAAGLAHDLGRLVLALDTCPVPLARQEIAFLETPTVLNSEREQLGADHTQIGAWFMQMNRLPAFLADVAEYHHAPDRAANHRDLVAVVAVAEDLANLWYAAHRAMPYCLADFTNQWLRQYFGCSLHGSRECPPSAEDQHSPYRGMHPVQIILQQAAQEIQQLTW